MRKISTNLGAALTQW